MEIINLKTGASSEDGAPAKLQITDIKQAAKNANRVNIFVNKEYSFSLDITQLVDFKLKIGTILTDEDLEKYQKASLFGKFYQRMLEWVLLRPRSIKEAKDHLSESLYKKNRQNTRPQTEPCRLSALEQKQIIDKLINKGYLDDEKFARYFVENRFVKKGVSLKRLKLELQQKGIAPDIIDAVLQDNPRNDSDEIQKIIAKKRRKYDDQKLLQYLVRQGFSYDDAKSAIEKSREE